MASSKKTSAKSQKEKFIETARALDCDEADSSYNEAVKNLAKQAPQPRKPNKKGKRNG